MLVGHIFPFNFSWTVGSLDDLYEFFFLPEYEMAWHFLLSEKFLNILSVSLNLVDKCFFL